jgi:presenilin-like A22 family membrane protease
MNKDKKREIKDLIPFLLMGSLFVLIHGLALLLTIPFEVAGMEVFENPDNPLNLFYFFFSISFFTVVILLIGKFWKKFLIKSIILGATGTLAFYVFFPLLAFLIPEVFSLFLSIAVALFLVVTLVKYPEWYVIDVCCITVGAGSVAMFGISLSVSLVLVLLILLAIYDAISVYKTKHMIDLAETVLDLKLPIILVIPKNRYYSLIAETKSLKEKLKNGDERDAFFMGLGDVVIPGILVVSAFHNVIGNGLIIALSVMLGTIFGFITLVRAVSNGKPQAGLPYLCSGAIIGYLVSSYLLFGKLGGLIFPI